MLVSPHSERNKQPILDVLTRYLNCETDKGTLVLEVSSGSGQHVSHFAKHFTSIVFQPSEYDLDASKESINAHIAHEQLQNVRAPIHIDASNTTTDWIQSDLSIRAIINSNMIHISPWACTKGLMYNAGKLLARGNYLFTYGPYNVNGEYTSQGNKDFDQSLKKRNAEWAIRDVSDVAKEAAENGLKLVEQVAMPANNFTLVFQKE
jgi:hypothetical protein